MFLDLFCKNLYISVRMRNSTKNIIVTGICSIAMISVQSNIFGECTELAHAQDVKMQMESTCDIMFAKNHKFFEDNEVTKPTSVFLDILGNSSKYDKNPIKKHKTNNGGFILGSSKELSDSLALGVFTSFQYADMKINGSASHYEDGIFNGIMFFDGKGKSSTTFSGVCGTYTQDNISCKFLGGLGYTKYSNDFLGNLAHQNDTKYGSKFYGWSGMLSGEILYNTKHMFDTDINLGPIIGVDYDHINIDKHNERAIENGTPFHFTTEKQKAKSLDTFIGIFASKNFSIREYESLAYATIGWNCECYRRGNKIKNTRDRYNAVNNAIRYDRESSGAIKSKYFMPKNTIKMKAGFESKISEKFICEASVGLYIGHHYYAASGDIGAIYSF